MFPFVPPPQCINDQLTATESLTSRSFNGNLMGFIWKTHTMHNDECIMHNYMSNYMAIIC